MIKKYIICAFILLGLLYGQAFSADDAVKKFDGREWRIGYNAGEEPHYIIEYVTGLETVDNWTELVTEQLFPLQNVSPDKFAQATKDAITKKYPGTIWNTISSDPSNIIYEWELKNCPDEADQHEIAKVALTIKGIKVYHYATKKLPLAEEKRKQWIEILKNM